MRPACKSNCTCTTMSTLNLPEKHAASLQVNTHMYMTTLQSIHKKIGSGELPYLAIFRDFIVHSAVLRNLKFEKGSKKGT